MHRTEGPDYILESGKRRYKETPTPETVVNKFAMNAIQEEICLAIENAGITLAATGAADRTAGWGQLDAAIIARGATALAHVSADGLSHSQVTANKAFLDAMTGALNVDTVTAVSDGTIASDSSFIEWRKYGRRIEVNAVFDANLSGSPTYVSLPLDDITGVGAGSTINPQRKVAISYQASSASAVVFAKTDVISTVPQITFYVDTGNLPLGTPVYMEVFMILDQTS